MFTSQLKFLQCNVTIFLFCYQKNDLTTEDTEVTERRASASQEGPSGHLSAHLSVCRFEAAYTRELYQIDITYVYLLNQTICYLVVVLDDYSRFCVSCEWKRDYCGISMIEVPKSFRSLCVV